MAEVFLLQSIQVLQGAVRSWSVQRWYDAPPKLEEESLPVDHHQFVVKADKRVVSTVEVSGSVREGSERFEFCVRKAMN
jgi:hypothetical protein